MINTKYDNRQDKTMMKSDENYREKSIETKKCINRIFE